jgi:hypothetical protein
VQLSETLEPASSPVEAVESGHSDGVPGEPENIMETEMNSASMADNSRVYWTSFWLRKPTLFGLAALFIGLLASLIVVWFANKSQHGFRPTLSKNHYAWTYGPTTILVVVLSFWRQVDYHCKLIQPWQELRNGSTSADRSMLLDYLSPLNITSFVRAIRHRHAAVAASIAGFAILKAVVLSSTGLLRLTPVLLTTAHPVTLTTSFDSRPFWATIPAYDSPWKSVSPHGEYVAMTISKESPLYNNVSTSPVYAYVEGLGGETVDTAGILGDVAYQTFETDPSSGLRSISVDVDTFFPNVSCEIAKPTLHMRPNDVLVIQLESTTCSVGAQHQSDIEIRRPYPVSETVSYNVLRVNCSETDATEKYTIFDADTPYDFRLALLISDLNHLNLTYSANSSSHNTMVPPKAASVICKIDYTMFVSAMLRDFASGSLSLRQLGPTSSISNLTGMMLGEMVYSAISESTSLKQDTSDIASPFFAILSQTLDGAKYTKRLLSSEELQSSARQVFAGVSAHFVQENFLRTAGIVANGTAVRVEDRLVLGAASFWLMLAGLGLVITLTFCIIFTAPRNVVPRDPGLLSTDAAILSSSPSLQELLESCHDKRTSQMIALLSDFRFSTVISETFEIGLVREGTHGSSKTSKTKANPWIPLSARYPMSSLTLTLPLVAIVVLEVLYRISVSKNGFAAVSGSESTATYISRYGSALVVLLIATCFNSLDFTTASFAPYSCLRSRPIPGDKGMSLCIIGSLPPVALLRSIKGRHGSSFTSNLAGMVGSVLAIVASGLWTIDRAVVVEDAILASVSSEWNLDWFNSSISGDSGAANAFDLIQHASASMPTSIYQGVVLPDITNIRYPSGRDLSLDQEDPVILERNITVQIDGLRPLLSCQVIDDEHITVDFTEGQSSIQRNVHVSAFPPLPIGCQHGSGTASGGSSYNFTSEFWFPYGNETTHIGNFYDLHLGPQTSSTSRMFGEDPSELEWQPDNPAGCPSIGAIFAAVSPYNVDHDEIVAVVCSQKLQQTPVNVTFTGRDLMNPTMSSSQAPVILKGSYRNLTNGTDGIDEFPYRVQAYLQDDYPNGILTRFTYGGSDQRAPAPPIDAFMNHLLFGPNRTAPDAMLGKKNQQTFIKALNDLYAKYMCLVIDKHFREPVEVGDAAVAPGIAYTFASRIRLNATSKVVMQVMLGAMVLLGLLTSLLADLRTTLPRKPTSIASRMALLAGSDLCAQDKGLIPHDAIWGTDEELSRIFDGWLVSLGWWKRSESVANNGSGDTSLPEDMAVFRGKQGSTSMRFGIDVGAPEQLGFRRRKW